jgi:hypothetical protein
MKKPLTTSLVILLVLTLALPAWAGRGHRPRPHHPPRHHHHQRHHHSVHLHALGAGLLGIGLVTGAAIAAGAFHQPQVVVHHPAPPPRPRPAPPRWHGKPYRPHKHRRHHELGAAQVTVQLLNVRQNPGRHHPVIMQVPHGTYLSVRATSDRWLFVSLGGGRVGWVMKRHTTWGRPYADG